MSADDPILGGPRVPEGATEAASEINGPITQYMGDFTVRVAKRGWGVYRNGEQISDGWDDRYAALDEALRLNRIEQLQAIAPAPPPATAPGTPSRRMEKLIAVACTAAYDCGNWRRDEEDEPYSEIDYRNDLALEDLHAAVAQLESDNARLTRDLEETTPNSQSTTSGSHVSSSALAVREPGSDDLIKHFGFYAREYSRINIAFCGGDQTEIAMRRMDEAERKLRDLVARLTRELEDAKRKLRATGLYPNV